MILVYEKYIICIFRREKLLMLYKIYHKVLSWASYPQAVWILAALSFFESFIFPFPAEVLLIPMILVHREKAWFFAGITTVFSVLGGYAGYFIGAFLFQEFGMSVLSLYNKVDAFISFQEHYQKWGSWIVFVGGLTPLPYKVVTISSGVVQLDAIIFGVASLLSRGARFFLVAGLLYYMGAFIREFIEKRLGILLLCAIAVFFAGYIFIK